MALLRSIACLVVAGLLVQGDERSADRQKETVATTALELRDGATVSLRYRSLVYAPDAMQRARSDPFIRDQLNQRWPLALQTELKLPVAVSLNGRRVEPDTYRVGLWMNEAGAFELMLQLDQEPVRFPFALTENRIRFPYLAFTLAPAEEGLFALTFQWGTEFGRTVFELAR